MHEDKHFHFKSTVKIILNAWHLNITTQAETATRCLIYTLGMEIKTNVSKHQKVLALNTKHNHISIPTETQHVTFAVCM